MQIFLRKRIFISIFSIFVFFFSLLNVSCSSDNDSDFSPLNVSTDKGIIGPNQSTVSLYIESKGTDTWQVNVPEENKSYTTVDEYKGVGNDTLQIIVDQNTTTDTRFITITISNASDAKKVYITQNPSEGKTPDTNSAKWIELPKKSNIPNTTFVGHFFQDNNKAIRNYSMLYDTINKFAYWIAYPMHSYYLGNSGRTDAWDYDPAIKNKFQPTLFKGFSASNTDRGHQIPSGDRTKNKTINKTTFYFSNMTAQDRTLNQGIWAKLEDKVRVWTRQCDTLYVVTGAMIKTNTDTKITYTKDNNGVNIARPKYYYKALAKRKGNTYYTIAYKMDNKTPLASTFTNYAITVSQLEKETGFTFFPSLSDNVKNKIENNQWN